MILITTPTGKIGSPLVTRLLAAGTPSLRVLVRDPAKLDLHRSTSVDVIQGSLGDPAALEAAFAGVDAVFYCLPDAPDAPDYIGHYVHLATLASAALRRKNVPRAVVVSAAGPTPADPAGPISALHTMERILGKSGAAFRWLRCGSFFENLLWQASSIRDRDCFSSCLPGHVAGPHLATDDIAGVAAAWLQRDDWTDTQTVSLLGPNDLTFDEIARLLSAHLGRTIRHECLAPEAYRTELLGAGYSASAAQGLIDMYAHLEDGYADDPFADRLLTPTSLEDWLRRQPALAPLAAGATP